jgi:hypothetical protein
MPSRYSADGFGIDVALSIDRIAVVGDEPGGEGGGPEAVARSGETDTGVGRVDTRVQATHQQPHPWAHRVGERAPPGEGDE